MYKITKEEYQEAIKRAKENLKGEELDKCIEALTNYWRKCGSSEE